MNVSTAGAAGPSTPVRVPVLIIGGGAAGLTSSMLLSQLGVEHLLINSRPETSDIPKAHSLNQRTMEILEDVGIADEVAAAGTPPEALRAAGFYAGFAGPDPDYGRLIAKLEARGAGGADENWRAASSWLSQNLPQNLLEPILRRRAEALAPAGAIRFNHTLLALEQDEAGVTSTVRDNHSGEDYTVRSQYLLGADGGRTVASQIGVTYDGLGVLTQTATLHVSADFSQIAKDPDVLIRWIVSPQSGAGLVMVPVGPKRWGPDSEEWVIHVQYPVDDARASSDEKVEADARVALGLPDHPMQIHKITRWEVDAVEASNFSVGRTFLLGDAAHRHPPTGGLGLTSAIQDAHNLCWKLAAVLADQASPALLDTYEAERRPAVSRNTQRSLENALNHFKALATTGVSHERTPEDNWASLKRLFSDRPEDAQVRREMLRVVREGTMEFGALDIEHGTRYTSDAIVPDGTEAPEPLDEIRVYQPSTRPGSPLPHAWIDDEDGHRRPIKDLIAPGRFLLIAGEDGQAWCEAARAIAAANELPIDALRIGHLDGDLFDPRLTWLRHREITPTGAVLIRPDRFVAWRAHAGVAEPAADLAQALSQILSRPITPPIAPRRPAHDHAAPKVSEPQSSHKSLSGHATVDLDVPIEEAYTFLADIEAGPTWQDGLRSSTVLERDSAGRPALVDTVTDGKVKDIASRVRFTFDEPHTISWSQEKGDLKRVDGRWELEALDTRRTRVTYSLDLDPGRLLGMLVRGPVEMQLRDRLISARPVELQTALRGR